MRRQISGTDPDRVVRKTSGLREFGRCLSLIQFFVVKLYSEGFDRPPTDLGGRRGDRSRIQTP